MRTCKRCKTNEATNGSLVCEKCNERNKKHIAILIAQNQSIHTAKKSLDYDAYGGLGSELESGHMNYNAYYF